MHFPGEQLIKETHSVRGLSPPHWLSQSSLLRKASLLGNPQLRGVFRPVGRMLAPYLDNYIEKNVDG